MQTVLYKYDILYSDGFNKKTYLFFSKTLRSTITEWTANEKVSLNTWTRGIKIVRV